MTTKITDKMYNAMVEGFNNEEGIALASMEEYLNFGGYDIHDVTFINKSLQEELQEIIEFEEERNVTTPKYVPVEKVSKATPKNVPVEKVPNMTTTNKQFTFDFNFGKKTSTPSAPKVRPASTGQIKYYTDLCKQKRVEVQDPSSFSFDTMSKEIERLLAYHPASDSQIELINTKVDDLSKLVKQMKFTKEQLEMFQDYNTDNLVVQIIGNIIQPSFDLKDLTDELTGGKEGTASLLIEGLINIERQFTDQLPPSLPQVEMLVNMFLYPDANFEDYGVPRRINLEDGLWRKPTPQEFAEYIQDNMTKQEASGFIDMHRGGFYEWRQTRIRPEQMRYIQTLEARLSDDSKISAIQQAVNMDGTISDVPSSKNESIIGTAYVPLTEEQLLQLSIEDASTFIDQLKAELGRSKESTLEGEDTVNLRGSSSIQGSIDIEFQHFQDLMFKLESVAGYSNEEVHEVANYNLVADDNPEAFASNRLIIREFMKELLETGAITYIGLLQMLEDSVTAQRILLDM